MVNFYIDWLSKDVIFLGYDGNLQQGKAIREFIKEYHSQSNSIVKYEGIIRAAVIIDFIKDDFNSYALQTEGFNGLLPDFDMIDMTRRIIDTQTPFYGFDDLSYISNAGILNSLAPILREICKESYDVISGPLGSFVEVYRPEENSFPMLMQFFGNQIFGRFGEAHPYFMK